MQWKEEYVTGIPEIDRDHEKLVACVTEIEEAVTGGKRWSTLHFALEQLVASTTEHFTVEESLMRIQCYPQMDEHIVSHIEFLQRLETLEMASLAGTVTRESIAFLMPLLEEHFLSDDKHYAFYAAKAA